MKHWLRILAATAAAAWLASSAAEPTSTGQKILIGMSAPLSGPLAPQGRELERGVRAGLAQAAGAGGIAGRQIELVVQDDAGQPERAVANTRALLDAGVLALTAYQGAASIEAVLPLIDQSGIALIGASSSAEVLRDPPRRGVFNLRAGAREEAAAMVLQLDTVGLSEIAVVAQDDALGRAGLEGVQVELVRLAIKPQAVVRLARDASGAQVIQAAQAACKSRPQALVLVLDARNALEVIRAARKTGCQPQFYAMSEAGAQLAAGASAAGELAGVIVSQVLPHPGTASSPIVQDYRRQILDAPPTYPGLEGFLYGRVVVEALRRCARDLTRRCLATALETRPVEMGGYRVQFGPNDRRGSRFVEMTIVTPEGRFRR